MTWRCPICLNRTFERKHSAEQHARMRHRKRPPEEVEPVKVEDDQNQEQAA